MPTLQDAAVERCHYDGVPSEYTAMTENSTIPDGLRRLLNEIDSHWRVERKVS
jgi:hypothetical protein